ncbi:hemerythrin domain-containing protein [Streptomyces sp. NPDC093065]|uniref:hemerythrin domain-containing protein n=1 Tax=Streptomyces sp. NPDC093065 TaxID=3366021 RepID=UPI003825909F
MLINPDAPADKPEIQQMKVIHRVMRREFAQLPDLVAAVGAGDTARARLLGEHLSLVLDMLHEHHEAEDELLWPVLVQRVPLKKDLIAVMETQHQAIGDAVDAVAARLPAWTAQAGATARDLLAGALRDLGPALTEHLDLEEEEVLPLIHDHLTVPEWLAPQKHAMKHGPRTLTGKLTLAGMVLEDATPRERAWFLGEMPAPARLLWRLRGARRYDEHVRLVRAGVPSPS